MLHAKIIEIGQCFTKFENNTGTVFFCDKAYFIMFTTIARAVLYVSPPVLTQYDIIAQICYLLQRLGKMSTVLAQW